MTKEEFEADLIQFANERKEQKLRGLNNYNVMTAIRHADAEVGMHSNFIYSLLDIDGEHYQGSLFADLFVKNVLGIGGFGKITKVAMEDDANGRRIDFVIKSDKYSIGIEMKTRNETADQEYQLYDYYSSLLKEDNSNNKREVYIFYLTPTNAKKPDRNSYCKNNDCIEYKQITFDNEIIQWLQECKRQVANITNLNNAIGYYMDVVNIITEKYTSPLNRFEDFFLDEEKGIERFSQMKDVVRTQILEIVSREDSILSENEAGQEADSIMKGYKETQEKLCNQFYEKLFEPIVDDKLLFGDYVDTSKNRVIRFIYDDTYQINLYLKKDSTRVDTIGVGIAWKDYKNNEARRIKFEKANDVLGNTTAIKDYIVSKSKGVRLLESHILPSPTVKNLLDTTIAKIDSDLKNEILEHIDTIKKFLNLNHSDS